MYIYVYAHGWYNNGKGIGLYVIWDISKKPDYFKIFCLLFYFNKFHLENHFS